MKKLVRTQTALALILTFGLLSGSIPALPASAQAGIQASLEEPDAGEFPVLLTYLDVVSEGGSFYSGLTKADIRLLEDNQPRDLAGFRELHPGVQLVLALNVAPPFAIQDVTGNSRWDYLKAALQSWADQEQLSTGDDLSIISNDGLEKTHLRDHTLLSAALDRYRPQPRNTPSNLNVLARAIEIAADPPPEMGMKRIVIFLTPPPSPEDVAALENLTSLALENEVRVYPWLVSSPAYFDSAGADQLKAVARETGGDFFAFSGSEPIPDLETIFQKLRGTYLVEYRTGITSGGSHTLEAVISTAGTEIRAEQEFNLTILPPNPILSSPPREISRENPQPDQENYPPEEYQPQSYPLEVIIEFPDNLPRPLEKTILRVDGEIMDVNQQAPFTVFTWDLTEYSESGTHFITVEAQDSIGLTSTSVRTPVEVIINRPDFQLTSLWENYPFASLGLLAVILGCGAVFLLIVRGVIRPREVIGQNHGRSPNRSNRNGRGQPPADPGNDRSHDPGTARDPSPPHGYLLPEGAPANRLVERCLPLVEREITIGSDPSSTIIALADPSVAELHARLIKSPGGFFQLQDEGSVTGTWINYNQLNPQKKSTVSEGDLVHFGRVGFRIQKHPPPAEQPHHVSKEHHA